MSEPKGAWTSDRVWESEPELPSATHQGQLSICGVTLRVYRLDDGRAVIHADDLHSLFAAWAAGVTMPENEAMELVGVLRGIAPPPAAGIPAAGSAGK